MPRRNFPSSGPGAPTVAEYFAALGHFMAVGVSATTLGYAASIVAHDRCSTIGIAHLTVSTISLVMGASTCVGTCTLRKADLRLPLVRWRSTPSRTATSALASTWAAASAPRWRRIRTTHCLC
ncbi:hypothetical protein K438DRAFT_1980916 [Mycena galopus ATCC 62051]|nr:hypothetical protein K438DRAFT_1980916 [Mycena galopus ATCC 62051]